MNWHRTFKSAPCGICGFELFVPIAERDCVAVGLYDDNRYPGRCILTLRSHYDHLDQVPPDEGVEFFREGAGIGGALRHLGLGDRINYAVFGNEHPHVHMHIVPRDFRSDPHPRRPIWEDERKAGQLQGELREYLVESIAHRLTSVCP